MSTRVGQEQVARHQGVAAADLPIEGKLPSLEGANDWLNSQPLTPSGLRGHVVVVQFWTYTCINWLRTQAHYRAWSQRYRDSGLVTIGVHTPEFKFEHDLDNVRWAVQARKIDYPVAIDNDFEVWRAFANQYWPALYFIDSQGRIRHHRFGEGDYERSEMVIRQLLADAGVEDLRPGLASVEPNGDEVQADWEDLGSPESYLGYDQATGFEAGGRRAWDKSHDYTAPEHLRLNRWGLTGDWTVRSDASALNGQSGRVAYQFHARDVNLVMGPARKGSTVRFRVLLDGESAAGAHGADVDAAGNGTVVQQRMYQLIRQSGPIRERRFEIEFLDSGAEAFCFTFG
ncbi:MAG TPA: redoxin domain-containing protein [Candidatus Limnocylindrales bacterium]|nr:redoxin domain-containing protein [Candidatus Limnocylindrales bacterium]